MIRQIAFTRFRGFESLNATLMPHAYIVGPNSAGKSTILEAVAFAELCLQRARRLRPDSTVTHDGTRRHAYSLPPSLEDEDDPVRYDFGNRETRVRLTWVDETSLTIVWPEEDAPDSYADETHGYFYLQARGGTQVSTPQTVKKHFPPTTTIVPVVTPLDRIEDIKNSKYIESKAKSRLASRHFRNHAAEMHARGAWEEFKDFASTWAPELKLEDVVVDYAANRLSVFYSEGDSRVPKELAWAGDGLQIWIQLLWHLYNAENSQTIVLDEPDVYLHPDLQRRLVRLLDRSKSQILLASHSADIASEAPLEGVLWVDRRTNLSRRPKSKSKLISLGEALGSSFNIALARTMRARVVVATDCDVKLLKSVATTIGAARVATEQGIQLLQLTKGADVTTYTSARAQIDDLAPTSLPAILLLQGSLSGRERMLSRLRVDAKIPTSSLVVLERRELLNYLLDPKAIARISGSSIHTVEVKIAESVDKQYDSLRTDFVIESVRSKGSGGDELYATSAQHAFDLMWTDWDHKVMLAKASTVLEDLNRWLSSEGYKEVDPPQLARTITADKIDAELFSAIYGLEHAIERIDSGD
ncbi:AAA family ATPase [Rhodococcoides kroppenstedtii]|uniref:AAA family ATPase n=1 Tax=Rhodococcoides kroppenstedtii TaxID=293050 RepID=UPI001BDF3698|nr:ATP-binding protein [Rhodococcus kroppenstedtii]MBT1192049.1 AAA family ATPase [Rhodococcus kroppenstedtii]